MKIYAHRGLSSEFPENTMAAFRGALDLGVEGIELDVHASADGVPVVIHDDHLERTTNGSGPVTVKTAVELSALDAGDGHGVPTLEEVVALVDGRLRLDIEIKGQHCERVVLNVLAQHPETSAAVYSFDWQILANVHRLAPRLDIWVLTPTIGDAALTVAQELQAKVLAVHFRSVTESTMAKAVAAGRSVMAWTVNDQHEADRLRALGVDSICTDEPQRIH
jgi:glycerophosphoryl diester phosphodiesterase